MACEKCWGDAYIRTLSDPSKGQAEHYRDLLAERKDNPCPPDAERGQWKTADVKLCPYCGVRPVDAAGMRCTECDDMLNNCDEGDIHD